MNATSVVAVRDSEIALVGAICQGHEVPELAAECFFDEERRAIYTACRELEATGSAICFSLVDAVLDSDRIQVSPKLLEDCFEVPVSGLYLGNHADTIRKSYLGRRELLLKQDFQDAASRGAFGRALDLADELRGLSEGNASTSDSSWMPQRIGNILEPPPENEPVIDGMLRRGEVGSIIAVPKAAKSWMMLQLGFSVIEGQPWLGRNTTEGHVLLVDNELRPNTIQNRASRVAREVGANQAAIDERFSFVPLRGVEFNFLHIERHLERVLTARHTLVVFDAKYRFFAGMDENSNGDNTTFHNTVDRWSQKFNVAIELVHHSSKGNQGGKAITDVGAGGGAQSRAADCHTVLREHEEEGMFVLESELRTFKKPEPQTVQFNFPVWRHVDDVDPVVKQQQSRTEVQSEKKVREKITTILQMLRLSSTDTHSENKLSGNHPASTIFRAAIKQLESNGEIEWVTDFKEPRSKAATGGWKLVGMSNDTNSTPTDTHPPAL